MKNRLYFGDNLTILREYIGEESVDLIYLDPPFNSNATYNVLFEEKSGEQSAAQITAFEDTWHWGSESEMVYRETITEGPKKLSDLLQALLSFLGRNDMMAYLIMMAPRLVHLHRVLKSTGGIYLHCDPTASHYLKLVMDAVFKPENFRNEIIWHYGQRSAFYKGHFSRKHDVILFYGKSSQTTLHKVGQYWSREEFLAHRHDVKIDDNGLEFIWTDGGKPGVRYKRYVDDVLKEGKPLDTVWDIPLLNAAARERLGYPTQKPESLLERIIQSSSKEGDLVLDPFCGCGTTIAVAERLNRRWVGIDITHLAITLIRHRLSHAFQRDLSPYEVIGDPKDLAGAKALAEENRYQFEWWVIGMVDARPGQDKKKGADSGIDGLIYFIDDATDKAKKILIQVKSGHVSVKDIRDLKGVLEREKAEIGVFITLEDPTKPMSVEAASAGFYEPEYLPGEKYRKLQILTVEALLAGKGIHYPRQSLQTFKKSPRRYKGEDPVQKRLL